MGRPLLFLVALLLSISTFAQTSNNEKADIILKVNGDEMKGKITKITDTDLTFIYSGETLEYTIKKSDILKITHSSGRVETINQPPLPSDIRKNDQIVMKGTPADHHNRIAVLPFHYLIENQPGADEIGLSAQQDTYSFLSQHSAGYTLIDPRTTNALLAKGGVTKENITGFTMNELCNILGVEYIIDGTVKQNKASQTSYTSDNSNTNVKRNANDKVTKVNSYGSTFSNAEQRYDVSVSLNIYNDNNANIYNQSHKAFFSNTDGGFGSPLQYLLKRCPLYRK
ncbi:hypothetical protein [Pedobacter chitinilyticus]|uniref:Uncharacterized protein n=1 Tax=Pedobacter chitinilyticus TaxID=2233776 RepID=A0A443YMP1_9SPHI|nr:hypothetical protein [Pedobacter chitinilyticus]RWU05043.1 hypothetical protein DPV69_17935 [Pedobacter chitinilyticus]